MLLGRAKGHNRILLLDGCPRRIEAKRAGEIPRGDEAAPHPLLALTKAICISAATGRAKQMRWAVETLEFVGHHESTPAPR